MLVFHGHNAEQNHNVQIGDKSFESVTEFKHLRAVPKNQNCLHEKIKSKVNSPNACYSSVQNFCLTVCYQNI